MYSSPTSFQTICLTTPLQPELPGGEYEEMFHPMQPQQTHFVPPPIHTSSYMPSSYDMPPDLIRDGEEGYASLPQSPLDFAFPTAITSGVMHSDPAAGLPQTICRSYVDENQMLSTPACFNDGMNGISVGPSMLSGMSYVSSCSGLVFFALSDCRPTADLLLVIGWRETLCLESY